MAANYADLIKEAENIAIIGCSANRYRTSYHIASYLRDNGYRIIPVNPNYDEVLGLPCYDTMHDIPEKYSVDIVDIFRDSKYTAEMVQQVIDWSKNNGQKPVIWTQLDVSSEEAEKLAKEEGFRYVKNECLMVQHEKAT